MNLFKWMMDGGGKFLGYDENGERMYSVSNGTILAFCLIVIIAVCAHMTLVKTLLEVVL